MKRNIFNLDLTNCTGLPSYLEGKTIPCITGVHYCDIDVREDELPSELVAQARDHGKLKARKQGKEIREDLPMGFNIGSLPIGAVLTVTGITEDGND